MNLNFVVYLLVCLICLGCNSADNPLLESDEPVEQNRSVYRDVILMAPPQEISPEPSVRGEIRSVDDIYDGDTIQDVHFRVCDPCLLELRIEGLPIVQDVDSTQIYYVVDIRISGIDTPEIRVSTKDARGNKRTEESRERERALAYKARDYLRFLINIATAVEFRSPEDDKYGGRIVAEVWILINGVVWRNVADLMIASGLAVEYDGGKRTMDWGSVEIP